MLVRAFTHVPTRSLTTLRIVAINDIYNLNNLASLHTLLNSLDPPADCVTLAGDFLSPSPLSSIDFGRGHVATLRACGVTHVSLGNHEADFKLPVLKQRLSELSKSVKVLNTNINELGFLRNDFITTSDGKVAVLLLGIMSDEPTMFRDRTFKGLEISDVVTSLDLAHQDKDADFTIALTHQSLVRDRELANHLTDSTIILGGHEHTKHHEIVGETRPTHIVKSGQDAETPAIVDIMFDSDTKQCSGVEVRFADLKSIPPCEIVTKVKNRQMSVLTNLEKENIVTEEILSNFSSSDDDEFILSSKRTRFEVSSVATLFCDAIRFEIDNCDLALINGAVVKGNKIYENNVMSYYDLKEELPFPTKMVLVAMTIGEIKSAVHWSRTNFEIPGDDERRGWLQTSSNFESLIHSDNYNNNNNNDNNDGTVLNVALPRNLMAGFCKIQPLMKIGDALKKMNKFPNDDDFIPALLLVVRFFCQNRWSHILKFKTIDDHSIRFEDIDTDGDGFIDREELRNLLVTVYNSDVTDFVVDDMLSSIDMDGDGKIDHEEFDQLLAYVRRKRDANLKLRF